MASIDTFNSAVSNAVNKSSPLYEAWIGQSDFTPESAIINSQDFNCGAICNELEYARVVSQYYVKSLNVDSAEGNELEALINGFIDLPRRGFFESDSTYRDRYKFITVQQVNQRRTTKWAILDAMKYFVDDVASNVQFIEQFDNSNLYFQIRFEGTVSTEGSVFLNNTEQGFLDNNYISGPSVGSVITYIGDLISRIKAAGVDFDVLFITQDRFTKTATAFIGTVQRYLFSDATILKSQRLTVQSDAEII